MKKKDVVSSKGRSGTKLNSINFKCGECLHFKKHALASKDDVCSKMGIRHYAAAPTCFTPDVTALSTNTDQFVQVVSLFNDLSRSQQRILLAMLRGKDNTTFGQKVFFRAVGKRDYLSNYLSGYIVGKTSAGELILQGDPDKRRRGNLYTAILDPSTELLNGAQFRARKQELRDKGMEMDPDQPLIKLKRVVEVDYEPPTLDGAPVSWFNKTEEPKLKKGAKRRTSTIKPLDEIITGEIRIS